MLKRFKLNSLDYDKTINILIVLYAAVLPLGFAIANITLGIMLVFFVFYLIKDRAAIIKDIVNDMVWIFVFSILFFIYLASLFYSEDIDSGINQVYKKVPILILTSFVFVFRKKVKKKTVLYAMKVFAWSVTFVCFVSVFLALYNCYDYDASILLYCSSDQNLASSFISYHKLYLSLYITISIFFKVYSIFYLAKRKKTHYLGILQVLILFSTLILLGSRNSILVSTFFIIGLPLVYWLKNKMIVRFILFSTTILAVVFSSFYFNPVLKEKIKEAINYENQYNINKRWGGVTIRKLIWEYSYITFKKNPLLGVGVGDVQKELDKSYLESTETSAFYMGTYNTHNDMLQILITTGIIGLSFFLLSLMYILYNSFKKKNYLHCLFVILFLFSGLTESLLERDMGIRIYSFFTILLFIYSTQFNENSSNT